MSNNNPDEYCIRITHIELHTTKPVNPMSWLRAMKKSSRGQKPDKFYLPLQSDKTWTINFLSILPKDEKREIVELLKQGKKVKIIVPKKGIPICLGKDAVEKIKSIKKNK